MPDALRQRLGEILEIESSNFNNHPTLLIDPSCHRIFPTFTNLKNYKRSPSQKKRFAKISLRFEKSFQNRLEIYCARGEKSYTCDVNESRHENAAIIIETQSHPHHARFPSIDANNRTSAFFSASFVLILLYKKARPRFSHDTIHYLLYSPSIDATPTRRLPLCSNFRAVNRCIDLKVGFALTHSSLPR